MASPQQRPNLRAVSGMERPDANDDALHGPREVLKLALQEPQLAGTIFDLMPPESFLHPTYVQVAGSIAAVGGAAHSEGGARWIDKIAAKMGDAMGAAVVSELAVEDIRCSEERLPYYASGVMARMQANWVGNEIADMKSKLQRMRPDENKEEYFALFADVIALEKYHKSLINRANSYGEFTG